MLQDQTIPVVPEGTFPPRMSLAMAYVPFQCWEEPLPEYKALCQGTVFASLAKPFMMGKGGRSYDEETVEVMGRDGKG